MKKKLVSAVLLVGFALSASAQDIITKKDGTDIQAKILEVTVSEVKFKKYNNLDGPTFTMPKTDILIVRYENGENEVFSESQKTVTLNTQNEVYPGMRYKEYKDFYNTREYVHQPGDPYTPFWIGFGDFFIPGLGNAITGEWGRAAFFFFTNFGLHVLATTQITIMDSQYSGTRYEYSDWYWVIAAVDLGMNIWSIWDAVHVAKVKNMYNQDLRAQRASLDLKIEPYLSGMPAGLTGDTPVLAAGLSVKLTF